MTDKIKMLTIYETPKCVVCGLSSKMLVEVDKLERWKAGEYVQKVWAGTDKDRREMLITGTHPECWEKMFGDVEE